MASRSAAGKRPAEHVYERQFPAQRRSFRTGGRIDCYSGHSVDARSLVLEEPSSASSFMETAEI